MYLSKKIFTFYILLLTLLLTVVLPPEKNAEDGSNKLVYMIPIENEVERGLEAFLVRSTNEAIEAGANHIIFEIDTPGGRVDSAGQIGKLLQGLEIPTTAYIVNEALSAGSYIALNSDTIYMKPNATMGASGVITSDGNAADANVYVPEYGAPKGEFLTLTPKHALDVGYAEGIVQNEVELLHALDLDQAKIVKTETSFAEEIARFVTSPIVIPILLSIASIG